MRKELPPLRVPVAGPWVTELEEDYAVQAVRAMGEGGYAYLNRFETAFARSVGRRFAAALPSCTSGIHLALLALDIGPGNEVVVPDATWIASSAPVDYVGGDVRFADIDEATWCLSPRSLEDNISERTKAVIAVDLYGCMPEMKELTRVTEEHGIHLIEDAAEAVGSRYSDAPAGSFGTFAVFSFHGSKTLATGEGGMLVTDDEALFERVLFLRDHGRSPGDISFNNGEVAFKYRMSDLQAAVGLAQLERLPELVAKKRTIFSWYRDRLGEHDGFRLNPESPQVHNSYWMTTVVLDPRLGIDKDTLRTRLRERGIDSRPFFRPLSSIPAYRDRRDAVRARAANSASYLVSATGLNLPSGLALEQRDVELVCDELLDIVGRV